MMNLQLGTFFEDFLFLIKHNFIFVKGYVHYMEGSQYLKGNSRF